MPACLNINPNRQVKADISGLLECSIRALIVDTTLGSQEPFSDLSDIHWEVSMPAVTGALLVNSVWKLSILKSVRPLTEVSLKILPGFFYRGARRLYSSG